jgi:P4 family phage/plasmid primase-like protien
MTAILTSTMSARDAAKRLGRDKAAGRGFVASCPVANHGEKKRGDINPSLSLWDDDNGRLAFNCLGHCDHADVRDALIERGILARDDQDTPRPKRVVQPVKPTPKKVEKPADGWVPLPIDTTGAPDETPERVLVRSGILEHGPNGLLLVKKDADYKVISKIPVSQVKLYPVCLRDGRTALVDVRIEYGWQDAKGRPDKEIRPVSLWQNTKTGSLQLKPKQWPLGQMQVYGQENVSPGDIVVIHEGPPKAVNGREMLPQYKHVAFCGGSGMAAHHDWSFLSGCRVVCMADNDKPGKSAMERIRDLAINAGALSFGTVEWSETTSSGWGIDDLVGLEAGADDAEMLIAEALMRSVEDSKPKPAFTKQEADLSDLAGFELHEDGLALAFAEKYRDRLRYCHTRGSWYHWTGSHWELEQTSLAFSWARELCRQFYQSEDNIKVRNFVAKASTAAAVERFARSDRTFAVTSSVWDKDALLLGTPGGVVDLRTGELRPANPADNISKVTSVAPAPAGTPPHTWLRFLDDATKGDIELQRFLPQVVGYCLTGDVSEECLFFIHGPGGNGKGVFLRTIGAIMGDYATSAAMDTFTASKGDKHPTDLAKLAGARMVTASETEEGRAWAESRIKELTGNERPISARFMRQDFFEYVPQFKLLIVGNHRPIMNNVDDAMRRRFNMIPFTHKPTVKDSKLKEKLESEYPAILRWMIDGCLDWQKNGLMRPSSVLEATKDYFDSQDVFGQWVKECCQIDPGNKDLWEKSSELYESWVRYCAGHGEESGKERDLGTKLTKIEVGKSSKRIHGAVTAVRTGIRLTRKNDFDEGGEAQ